MDKPWYRKLFRHAPEVEIENTDGKADHEDAEVQFGLGLKFASHAGEAQDYAQAAHWYRRAADQSHALAQFNLGMMYAEGQGVPQDYVQAHMWLNLAAAQLPSLGTNQRNTTVDARDRVASKMSPQQIGEAQELAFEWRIEHRHVGRLRAVLESMHLDKETPDRLAVVPDQVQAQSADLQGSPASSSVGLHGLMLEDRSSKPTRRTLNLRPSGRR